MQHVHAHSTANTGCGRMGRLIRCAGHFFEFPGVFDYIADYDGLVVCTLSGGGANRRVQVSLGIVIFQSRPDHTCSTPTGALGHADHNGMRHYP